MMLIYFLPLVVFPVYVFSFPNGTTYHHEQFPYMVAVILPDQSGVNGVLITNKLVLSYPIQGSLFGITVQLKSDTYEPFYIGLWLRVVKVYTHPEFDHYYRHCAMILTLHEEVALTNRVKLLKLPTTTIKPEWKFDFISYGFPYTPLGKLNSKKTSITTEEGKCSDENYDPKIHVCVEIGSEKDDLGSFMVYEQVLYGWNFKISSNQQTLPFYLIEDCLYWIHTIIDDSKRTTTTSIIPSSTTSSNSVSTATNTNDIDTDTTEDGGDRADDEAYQLTASTWLILLTMFLRTKINLLKEKN